MTALMIQSCLKATDGAPKIPAKEAILSDTVERDFAARTPSVRSYGASSSRLVMSGVSNRFISFPSVLSCIAHHWPVDHFPECADVFGPAVLVLEVVSVLPDIEAHDRKHGCAGRAFHKRVVCHFMQVSNKHMNKKRRLNKRTVYYMGSHMRIFRCLYARGLRADCVWCTQPNTLACPTLTCSRVYGSEVDLSTPMAS